MFDSKGASKPQRARCKGTLLINLRSYVQTMRDDATWQRIVAVSPPDDQHVLTHPLLASSWYPVGVWNRVLRVYLHAHGDVSAEVKRVARYVADRDLNTVLKFALSIATPDTIVARTGMFWSRYFDCGTLVPTMVKRCEWVMAIQCATDEELGPSMYICDMGVSAWVEQALSLAGAKMPRVTHRKCRFRGAPACEAVVVW